MKILLISQTPAYFEQFRKQNEIFPRMQAQYHWLDALNELKHQIQVFKYTNPVLGKAWFWAKLHTLTQKRFPGLINKYRNFRNLNYYLLPDNLFRSWQLKKQIISFSPDVIIFSGGISELSGSNLPYIKKIGVPTILIHGVHPQLGATAYEKDFVKYFDLIIVNDPTHAKAWKKIGAKKSVALPYSGINPRIHKNLKIDRIHNVIFVGTLFEERLNFLEQMVDLGIEYKLFGYVPKNVILPPKLKNIYQGEVWGEELITLLNQTQIAINLVPDHMKIGGNLRTFEIPSCGALQIANRCPTDWFVSNKEIVLFDSAMDLKNKIDFYLKNPDKTKKIVETAYNRVNREYTYKKRFQKILSLI